MTLEIKILCVMFFITSLCHSQDWKTYPYNPPGSTIGFSQDEGRHTTELIEWWYTSGHVTGDSSGKTYSYMLTYFHYPASIFDGFRILNITDHETGEFFQDTQPVNYGILSTTNLDIEASLFFGGTESWSNALDASNDIIPFEYTLSAFASFGSLSFNYETLKRPLILGDDGYLNQGLSNYTYYYSQTSNAVQGTFSLNGVTETVTGSAWIDRQYGDFNPMSGEQYEWFCIQLSNGMDINLWNIFTAENTVPENDQYRILSAYVDETTQYTSSDFQIERLGFQFMPDNVVCYSKQWRLTSTINNLDLIITALHDNTEVQLPFRFFEGATSITGTVNGIAVTGIGFAELLKSYEHPVVNFISPSESVYDTFLPIVWQLTNPDDGSPMLYDLEYSVDNQQSFIPIAQGLNSSSYIWNDSSLNENDTVWFKIIAYSIDGVLNSEIVSNAFSTTTLSQNELTESRMTIYPNPVETTLFLNVSDRLDHVTYQMVDIQGRLVQSFQIPSVTSEVDVRYLKSGVYFLRMEHESGTAVVKFIKK